MRAWPVRLRFALVAATVVLVALVEAACGGNDEPSPAAGVSSPENSAPEGGGDRVAQDGDQVSVHYEGTLADGEVFDSSRGGDPLQFTIGAGQVISGFDDAVRGLHVGDSVTVDLPPAEAYGERRDDLILSVPADGAPDGLKVGDQVQLGNGAPAVVTEITETEVQVDANHPLAGQTLTFDIELVAID